MSALLRPPRGRAGATLVELAVAIAILGIAAGVAGLALRAMPEPDAAARRAAAVEAVRRRALDERRVVAEAIADSAGSIRLVAFPDGRVLADSGVDVDPLSGRPRDAAR